MEARRRKLIAKVKIGQQQLGLDDDTYRALLEGAVGKRSAAKMTETELAKVVAVMEAQGFQALTNKHQANKPDVTASKRPLMNKLEALLADGNKPWRYAEAMAERMFGRKQLQWLDHDELHKLVAALQIQANRANKEANDGAE